MSTETLPDPTADAAATAPRTVADLLRDLGEIPPDRVRLRPAPGTATEADVIAARDGVEKRLFELVDGTLVEKAMGYYESRVAAVLIQLLMNFLDEHRLGILAGPDGMLRLRPGLVRIPDVSFIARGRLPGGKVPREPIPPIAPDLAVEVLSRSNAPGEIRRKLAEYFSAGTRLAWIVDPVAQTVRVHNAPEDSTLLDASMTLDGGDVLPGFRLAIAEWFERANRA